MPVWAWGSPICTSSKPGIVILNKVAQGIIPQAPAAEVFWSTDQLPLKALPFTFCGFSAIRKKQSKKTNFTSYPKSLKAH